MGYRSCVAFTIRFVKDDEVHEKWESFYTFLAEAKAKFAGAFLYNDPLGSCLMEVNEKEMQINFTADDVKWYMEYKDVQMFMGVWRLAKEWEDHNESIAGIYAEMGENNDDYTEETIGDCDFGWINLERKLTVDWR